MKSVLGEHVQNTIDFITLYQRLPQLHSTSHQRRYDMLFHDRCGYSCVWVDVVWVIRAVRALLGSHDEKMRSIDRSKNVTAGHQHFFIEGIFLF